MMEEVDIDLFLGGDSSGVGIEGTIVVVGLGRIVDWVRKNNIVGVNERSDEIGIKVGRILVA